MKNKRRTRAIHATATLVPKRSTRIIYTTVAPIPMEPYLVTTNATGKRADGSIERKRVRLRLSRRAPPAHKDRVS